MICIGGHLHMYLVVVFSFTSGNYGHGRQHGEYPVIRVFIKVFSGGVIGFHLHEKLIDLKFLNQKLPLVG